MPSFPDVFSNIYPCFGFVFFSLMQTIHTFFKCYPGGGMSFLLLDILPGASSKPRPTRPACFPLPLNLLNCYCFSAALQFPNPSVWGRKAGHPILLSITQESRGLNWKWSEREKLALFFPSYSQLSSSFCYYKRPEGQKSLYISSTSADMICPQGIPLLCITTIPRPFFLWAFLFHYSSIIVSDKKINYSIQSSLDSSSFEMDVPNLIPVGAKHCC